MEAEYERRLLFSFTASAIKELCSVFIVRESLGIALLMLDVGPAPTKLLKVPVSVLRGINIRIVTYLEDMLIMAQTMDKILISRDTVSFSCNI